MPRSEKPLVDNPIESSSEDVLGRAMVARDFAHGLKRLDTSSGVVVGVLGAWGSGKTSFISLMREEFAANPKCTVVDFNPWMFAGAQELVDVFFKEIAAELRTASEKKFTVIANALDEYGDVLSPVAMLPVVGAWWDRSYKSYKAARKWFNERTATSRRQVVTDALVDLEAPIFVVIDDIDRLSTGEIRDIFKLVRLTASFPNIVYVLAFDRLRVETALDDAGVPGNAYLEKILQLSFDLPVISHDVMRAEVLTRLSILTDGIADLRFSEAAWQDVFVEVVEPLIASLRDVNRLVLSARPTIEALGDEIETVDLLALEAVRVLRPRVFELVQKMRISLTDVSTPGTESRLAGKQSEVDELLARAGADGAVVMGLVERVFPAAGRYTDGTHYGLDSVSRWLQAHRVAHINYLDLYLSRTAPAGLVGHRRAEQANALLLDRVALARFLDGLDPSDLEDTIAGLEAFQDSFPAEAVVPASTELLNRIGDFPDREPRSFLDFNRPDIVVMRVVLRLFERVKEEAAREAAIERVLRGLTSWSASFELIESVGYREGVGHQIVSKEFGELLEDRFFAQVRQGAPRSPAREWNLFRIYWIQHQRDGVPSQVMVRRLPEEIRALFESATTVAKSQSSDSRELRLERRLPWDGLVAILGGDSSVREARDVLFATDGLTPLVSLIERYLSGWRPAQ